MPSWPLNLYRNVGLVKYMLSEVRLPQGAERVAIALADEKRGPHIIVTRDGRFVTCLARGMRVWKTPVIDRRTVDHVGERMESLRELVEKTERGEHGECTKLLLRIRRAGPGLTREEFDTLQAWAPLAGGLYLEGLMNASRHAAERYDALQRAQQLGRRHEPLLRDYHDASWAAHHFRALVGTERRALQAALDRCAATPWFRDPLRLLFLSQPVRSGILPFALRAFWLAARLPRAFFSSLEEALFSATEPEEILTCGASLLALGVGNRSHRARVAKTLTRFRQQYPADASECFGPMLCHTLVSQLQPERDNRHAQPVSGSSPLDGMTAEIVQQEKIDASTRTALEAMPLDARLAGMLLLPLPLCHADTSALSQLPTCLPGLVHTQARDWYVPDAHREPFAQSYSRKAGLALLHARRSWGQPTNLDPSAASAKPGRNQPCPCASGRKYKRCCGAN